MSDHFELAVVHGLTTRHSHLRLASQIGRQLEVARPNHGCFQFQECEIVLDGLSFQLHDLVDVLQLRIFVFVAVKHVLEHDDLIQDGNEFHIQLHFLNPSALLRQALLPIARNLHQAERMRDVLLHDSLFLVPRHEVVARGEHEVVGYQETSAVGYLGRISVCFFGIAEHLLGLDPADSVKGKNVEQTCVHLDPAVFVVENQLIARKKSLVAVLLATVAHLLLLGQTRFLKPVSESQSKR